MNLDRQSLTQDGSGGSTRHAAGIPGLVPLCVAADDTVSSGIAAVVFLGVAAAAVVFGARQLRDAKDDRFYVQDARGKYFSFETNDSSSKSGCGCLLIVAGAFFGLAALGGLLQAVGA